VAVLFSSVAAVREALPDLEAAAATVLAALLPGPFTFVVGTSVQRPRHVGTADSLGVRVPDHPALLELLGSLGTAIAATSANLTGHGDAATLADVNPIMLAHCAIAFEPRTPQCQTASGPVSPDRGPGGDKSGPRPASTVVDLRPLTRGDSPVVLREGVVPGRDALERISALF